MRKIDSIAIFMHKPLAHFLLALILSTSFGFSDSQYLDLAFIVEDTSALPDAAAESEVGVFLLGIWLLISALLIKMAFPLF